MPLTMDIAEFNNGSQKSSHFRDLIYAYHRALLNLASSLVILEYSLLIGIRYFSSHVNKIEFNQIIFIFRILKALFLPILVKPIRSQKIKSITILHKHAQPSEKPVILLLNYAFSWVLSSTHWNDARNAMNFGWNSWLGFCHIWTGLKFY